MPIDTYLAAAIHNLADQGAPADAVAEVVAELLGVDDEAAAAVADAIRRPRPDVDLRTYAALPHLGDLACCSRRELTRSRRELT